MTVESLMAVKRDLFGGAIAVETAANLIDASDLRQVPDSQEVFIYDDSNVSIVVEVLEKVGPQQLEDAVKFHFESLAHDNSAELREVESIVLPEHSPDAMSPPIVLEGVQEVRKFNHVVADRVKIYMALFRIDSVNVDLVVTFNVPIESPDGDVVGVSGGQKVREDFRRFVETLEIVDYGLFT